MLTQQLTHAAMRLSLSERVVLAQDLWQSIGVDLSDTDEHGAMCDVIQRDQELSIGMVAGRTHDAVMQAARCAIGCL